MADMLAGAQLAQGILACLVRRGVSGEGGLVEVSMMESSVDFQFEPLTNYFQDGGAEPQRTRSNSAHAYLGAPYGIYETADGHLALAMGRIPQLGELLGCAELLNYPEPASWFVQRDEIKAILARHLKTNRPRLAGACWNRRTSGAPTCSIGSGSPRTRLQGARHGADGPPRRRL